MQTKKEKYEASVAHCDPHTVFPKHRPGLAQFPYSRMGTLERSLWQQHENGKESAAAVWRNQDWPGGYGGSSLKGKVAYEDVANSK